LKPQTNDTKTLIRGNMPILYTFECPEHGEFDEIYSIADVPIELPCPECGKISKKIIALGHGGIQRDEPTWLGDINSFFKEEPGYKPVSNIGELRQFYKDNPTIRPVESHPSIPSSVGDTERQTEADKKLALKKRSDKAKRMIRDKRLITLQTGQAA